MTSNSSYGWLCFAKIANTTITYGKGRIIRMHWPAYSQGRVKHGEGVETDVLGFWLCSDRDDGDGVEAGNLI